MLVLNTTSSSNEKEISPKKVSSNSKNKQVKAAYAERRDVIYKSLLRNVKRFLWKKFLSEAGPAKFSKRTRGWDLFKEKVGIFYEKYFKVHSYEILKSGDMTEDLIKEVLGCFLNPSIITPGRSEITKQYTKVLRKAIKTFSPIVYPELFEFRWIQYFFQLLKCSGVMEEVIDSCTNLKMSKKSYERAVDSIISFHSHKTLMR